MLACVAAHTFAKHLKALRWRTPYRALRDAWVADPSPFTLDPPDLMPGPHT